VNAALAAVTVAVAAGGIAAVSARELRAALVGLAVVLVGSSLLADPLPPPATLGVRIVAALLAVAILQSLVPTPRPDDEPDTRSSIGWAAESLLAAAGMLGGIGIALGLNAAIAEPGASPTGIDGLTPPVLITGAAATLFAIAVTPAALGRLGGRRAIGLVLLTQSVILVRAGLIGAPGDLEQIAMAGLLLGASTAAAVLAREADGPSHLVEDAA
jgi:hypothetical protein